MMMMMMMYVRILVYMQACVCVCVCVCARARMCVNICIKITTARFFLEKILYVVELTKEILLLLVLW